MAEGWNTAPKKRPKGNQEDKTPWAAPAGAEQEEEEATSLQERVQDLESCMGRLSSDVGGIRRAQVDTANEVKVIQADLKDVKSWTVWVARLYKWAVDSYKYFPWR